MYDICCIGHITHDKIVTPESVVHMAGGTSFYFSNAINKMAITYHLVTALAETEMPFATDLQAKGIGMDILPSKHTVFFENIYPENRDYRTQRVLQKADPFQTAAFESIESKIFHLGPLLADDIPVELIQLLAKKGMVSLDVQGYLREVRNENVFPIDWVEKNSALPHIHFLKANETEMEKLTGQSDIKTGAKMLAELGVKEVIITLGSKGSLILCNGKYYDIPAFVPNAVIDATGCGDTYMAGYLSQRIKGKGIQYSGEFAAAMATIKINTSGPFAGTEKEVLGVLQLPV